MDLNVEFLRSFFPILQQIIRNQAYCPRMSAKEEKSPILEAFFHQAKIIEASVCIHKHK